MSPIEALHTAARHYSIDAVDSLWRLYKSIPRGESQTDACQYLLERIHALDAMLTEIESFVPADFRTLKEVRDLLFAVGQAEIRKLWGQLMSRWPVDTDYWYSGEVYDSRPSHIAVFETNIFEAEVGLDILRNALVHHGIGRILIMPQFAHVNTYESDLAFLEPSRDEGYTTSADMDWLMYASHESTVTLVGEWLIEAVKAQWSNWHQHIWRTWTDYLPE